jgi:thiol:disulfide interchange protein DsbC
MRTFAKSLSLLIPLLSLNLYAKECPSIPEVQSILSRTVKTPFTVVSVEPIKSFSACQVKTEEGETFFLSRDKNFLIEGILVKVPSLRISKEDYEKLKKNILFSVGRGKEVIVITNPLCHTCRQHKDELKTLISRIRLSFVVAAFNREQEKAAVDAICKGKKLEDFFKIPDEFSTCDAGKLKVWTVSDTMKKYGISGTPVFILPDGRAILGLPELLKELN